MDPKFREVIQLKKYAEKETVNRKGFKGSIKSVFNRGKFSRKLRQLNGNIDRSYKHWQVATYILRPPAHATTLSRCQ
jgi:hypothetical protein